jgi:proton-coupled amino acid transporter
MAAIAVLYLVFGCLCYLFFGDATNDVILVNVVSTSGLVEAIKTLLAVALLFQYPVSLFPATAILEESLGCINEPIFWKRAAVRLSVVALTLALTAALPNFELATAFVVRTHTLPPPPDTHKSVMHARGAPNVESSRR